jgi:hypothetical protein
MRRYVLVLALSAVAALVTAGFALAQSGHFIDRTVQCTDLGTQLRCTGKVAGLGGTTFTINMSASGTAVVTCTNNGGNVAPGQNTAIDVAGTTGPLPTPQNGNFTFSLTSAAPTVPNTPTCPNAGWTATVVDVVFSTATLTLFEDSNLSDTITVPVT